MSPTFFAIDHGWHQDKEAQQKLYIWFIHHSSLSTAYSRLVFINYLSILFVNILGGGGGGGGGRGGGCLIKIMRETNDTAAVNTYSFLARVPLREYPCESTLARVPLREYPCESTLARVPLPSSDHWAPRSDEPVGTVARVPAIGAPMNADSPWHMVTIPKALERRPRPSRSTMMMDLSETNTAASQRTGLTTRSRCNARTDWCTLGTM